MIWPDAITQNLGGIITFENLASIMHLIVGLIIPIIAGCARPMLAGYTLYQFITTLGKTLVFPEQHPWSDWSWDFFGDMAELLTGYGLIYTLGLNDKIQPKGPLKKICSTKGITAIWAILIIIWIILLIKTIT